MLHRLCIPESSENKFSFFVSTGLTVAAVPDRAGKQAPLPRGIEDGNTSINEYMNIRFRCKFRGERSVERRKSL